MARFAVACCQQGTIEEMNTKKLLLLTVALLVATSALSADRVKLPPRMLGTWCSKKQDGHFERGKCTRDFHIVIGPNGYEGTEHGCTTLKSTVRRDVYVMRYRCEGEGHTWFEDSEMRLDVENDRLTVTSRQSGVKDER